jgi:superfamily II DNA or RNA helicase
MCPVRISQRKKQAQEKPENFTIFPEHVLPCVELAIHNTHTDVIGLRKGIVYGHFRNFLSYQTEEHLWTTRHTGWDGKKSVVCFGKTPCGCGQNSPHVHFPTGLLHSAKEFFAKAAHRVVVTDMRELPPVNISWTLDDSLVLRDYQLGCIDAALKKGRGLIKAATGAGKTVICAGIMQRLQRAPVVFLVTSKDLMSQAADEFERFLRLDGRPITVGRVGGGMQTFGDVNVVTVQSAVRSLGSKYHRFDDEDGADKDSVISDGVRVQLAKILRSAPVMFCDEVQHWAADTCRQVSAACGAARFRFGVSATPWRDLNDDMLIDGCFGRAITDISASDLISKGVLVKPTIYFVYTSSLVRGNYATIYKECVVENEARNQMISDCATRLREEGRKVLVLVRQIVHGNKLQEMIPNSEFVNGADSDSRRKDFFDRLRGGDNTICIATSIFDEGIDVRPLDALILAGSGKSATRALQRIGRVIRSYEGKKDAVVVDFEDDVRYLKAHSRARRSIYEKEPLFEIRRIRPPKPIVK